MSGTELVDLLSFVKSVFPFTGDAEVTCEANPGTLSGKKLQAYRNAGINRLSIGVQSFQDSELQFLTRIHDARTAKDSVEEAFDLGFDNVSIDLIFGIPGQSLTSWRQTLEVALELSPQHISTYGLTFEPGTPLTADWQMGRVKKCDEELEREMYLLAKESLEAAGYEHYEISNFARPGFRCRHNEKYWDGSPYVGVGPSAHSYDGTYRWQNICDVRAYADNLSEGKLPVSEREKLSKEQIGLELILLGLRRREGLDLKKWKYLMHNDLLQQAERILDDLGGVDVSAQPFGKSNKLLGARDDFMFLTKKGLLLYDTICTEISAII